MNKDMREITDTKSEKTVSVTTESLNLEWKEMRNSSNCEILDRVDVSTEVGFITTYLVAVVEFHPPHGIDKQFYAITMLNGDVISIVSSI